MVQNNTGTEGAGVSEKVHEITALEAGGVGTTPKGTDLLRLYNGK